MVLTVIYSWRQPFDGLLWSSISGEVITVESDGPAARAGVQVGDVVLAVNGIPVVEAYPVYANQRAGDSVLFLLRRQEKPWQAEVTLERASPMVLARYLEPVLIAFSLWLLGVVVLALRPASKEARLFFVTNQVGSGAIAAGILSAFGPEIMGRLFSVLLCWSSPLFVYFHATFPVPLQNPRRGLLLKFFCGVALALSLPYTFWSLPRLKSSPAYSLLYDGVRLHLAVALLVGMGLLFHSYWRIPSQRVRQRVRFVVASSVLAFTPLLVLSVLPEVLHSVPLVPYELTFLFILLIPFSYGYAIYRHNLFQTDRILNRDLVYLILALFWTGLYLTLVISLNWLLPNAMLYTPLVGALLILTMTMTLPMLHEKVQVLIDRLFYRGWYNYRAVVSKFSQALNATLEEASLAELLVEQLPTTLMVRGAALLLSAGRDLVPICYKENLAHSCVMPAKCLACEVVAERVCKDGSLARFLQQAGGPVDTPHLHRALSHRDLVAGEMALLTRTDIQVWLPLVFHGELEGVLLLGAKMADDFYSGEDYRILETLAWQAAVTARNVRLVKELRCRLKEIEQSKQELRQTHRHLLEWREEERKHLAREIHDGPLQELVGISYRLRDYARQTRGSSLEESLIELRKDSLCLLEKLRRICTDLRPPGLDALGLAAAIRAHANEEVKTGPVVALDLMDEKGLMPTEITISLFRVYQEAMNNAIRHANATRIEVRLEVSSELCLLSVRDDGQGFVAPPRLETLAQEGHLGLLGMWERVELLGGELALASAPGTGTEVRVWVPLNVKCGARHANNAADWRSQWNRSASC